MMDHLWEEFSDLYKFIKPNKELCQNSFFDIFLFLFIRNINKSKSKNQSYSLKNSPDFIFCL